MSDLAVTMRPRKFDDLVGMEKLVKHIRGQFEHKHNANWLFTGQTGSGKTTVARILSVALQCRHQKLFGNPCHRCRRNAKYFSILEVNTADITGIDKLRDLLDGYAHAPMPGSRRRVYILDEMHQASKAAQNLLLKFTEDRPKTTVFIGCTTEPEKLIRTLRRRFTIYQVPGLGRDGIKQLVKVGLDKCNSERSVSELVEQLMEKHIDSPGLIIRAVQKYADTDMSAEEASNVELGANIDTSALCSSVIKGAWEDVSHHIQDANPEDMPSIRNAVQGYLKSILLGDGDFSHRTDIVADSILKLHMVRDEVPAVSAVLYKLCKHFSRYKR